jgi:curved DNA-binding protein CbpA
MRVGRLEARIDLYAVLGVGPLATSPEIRKAHRRLALISHPDLARGTKTASEERMKEINLAAAILLDASSRAHYDRLRSLAMAWPTPPITPPRTPATAAAPSRPVRAAPARPRRGRGGPGDLLSPRLLFGALAATLVIAFVSSATGGPVPVSSSSYRIPSGPQRVTMWAPDDGATSSFRR